MYVKPKTGVPSRHAATTVLLACLAALAAPCSASATPANEATGPTVPLVGELPPLRPHFQPVAGALPELRPPPNPGVTGPPPLRPDLSPPLLNWLQDGPAPPSPVAAAPVIASAATDPAAEAAALRAAMRQEVPALLHPASRTIAEDAARAAAMLALSSRTIDAPQLVIVVDRNPAAELLLLMLAKPGDDARAWQLIGATHVSTGQAGRKDYYITPIGVFAHTDAILDFRALGTYNEHHVRGLGVAGMRVWDFGWQWALKGWHTDGAGGDIRLQMHATDPALLERRLGRPASEGCIRLSGAMNQFLDRHGVLDADYEQAALQNASYRALLRPDRTPTSLAGRLLVVIDTREAIDAPPTQSLRPAEWPDPSLAPATLSPGSEDLAPVTN